jgi:ribosomal protein S12 methylthiotransferase accessory factor
MIRLNSSVRVVEPETTLGNARILAGPLGISRVTDITRLDRIGIPVFAGIRPTAMEGSLCVSAGKGVTSREAQIGAYMEAIEFALAEPGASSVAVTLATARDVLDGPRRPEAILDFCPIVRKRIDLSAPLACVEAFELISQERTFVPAELVLLPYVRRPGTGNFGSHSNGLASGNTVAEATLHALFEVIERDIRSFQFVRDRSSVIRLTSLPDAVQDLVEKLQEARLELLVRTHPNPYELPYFQVILWDAYAQGPYDLVAGYGCHLVREIALVRAITEAVQSRLSWIHGGRDDLAAQAEEFAARSTEDLGQAIAARFASLRDRGDQEDFGDVADGECECSSIAGALQTLVERLQRASIRHLCQIALTEPDYPLAVVRIVVPRLEYLAHNSHRLGPRLHAFVRNRSA